MLPFFVFKGFSACFEGISRYTGSGRPLHDLRRRPERLELHLVFMSLLSADRLP